MGVEEVASVVRDRVTPPMSYQPADLEWHFGMLREYIWGLCWDHR